MPLRWIVDREAFMALEADWNRCREADRGASIFLDHRWLADLFLRRAEEPIRILAWRDVEEGPWMGFLPLRRAIEFQTEINRFTTHYLLAGSHWADHNGALIHPDYEQQAWPELIKGLLERPWQRLRLDNLSDDKRTEKLIAHLREANCKIERYTPTDNDGQTDLSRNPVIELPADPEQWLSHSLSSNTRQKLRRFRRRFKEDSRYRIREGGGEKAEQELDAFVRLWQLRWQGSKGKRSAQLAEGYRDIISMGLAAGQMSLDVIEHEGQVRVVHAHYVDPVRRRVSFFAGARDQSDTQMPWGLLLHAFTIDRAIRNGFREYDLLRGDEPYKYSLGAQDRTLCSLRVERPGRKMMAEFLDRDAVPRAFAQLERRLDKLDPAISMSAFCQLLDADPNNQSIRIRFEQWLQMRGL